MIGTVHVHASYCSSNIMTHIKVTLILCKVRLALVGGVSHSSGWVLPENHFTSKR